FHDTSLVADTNDPHDSTGQALDAPEVVDPNLVNPWGISFSSSSPFWVSNAGSNTSTLYSGDHVHPDGSYTPISINSTVVTVPVPTGQVFNGTSSIFMGDRFIFDTLGGSVYGWSGGAAATQRATVTNAFYTGLAIGSNEDGTFLYAADDAAGRGGIDVFDSG